MVDRAAQIGEAERVREAHRLDAQAEEMLAELGVHPEGQGQATRKLSLRRLARGTAAAPLLAQADSIYWSVVLDNLELVLRYARGQAQRFGADFDDAVAVGREGAFRALLEWRGTHPIGASIWINLIKAWQSAPERDDVVATRGLRSTEVDPETGRRRYRRMHGGFGRIDRLELDAPLPGVDGAVWGRDALPAEDARVEEGIDARRIDAIIEEAAVDGRMAAIVQEVAHGAHLKSVGERHGITESRVSQLVGYVGQRVRAHGRRKTMGRPRLSVDMDRALALREAGKNLGEIAAELGVPYTRLRLRLLETHPDLMPRAPPRRPSPSRSTSANEAPSASPPSPPDPPTPSPPSPSPSRPTPPIATAPATVDPVVPPLAVQLLRESILERERRIAELQVEVEALRRAVVVLGGTP